jgi:hypothetical protein
MENKLLFIGALGALFGGLIGGFGFSTPGAWARLLFEFGECAVGCRRPLQALLGAEVY